MTVPKTASRIVVAFAALAVLLLGTYLRTRNAAQIYLPDVVLALDTDCYYHLRRAMLCLASFPRVAVDDAWLAWPDGATPTWGPGFDQLLALPAWCLGWREGLRAERVIAAVPVALGLLVVAASARLAAALEPDPPHRAPVALAAAVLAAAMPQSLRLSLLGATDHHVIEALAPPLLVFWATRAPVSRRAVLGWELQGIGLLALVAYAFPGTILTHGLVVAGLGLRALLTPTERPRGSIAFLGAALALGALSFRWTLLHGETFHHLQLSALQPLLLGLGGVFLGLLGVVPSRGGSAPVRALLRLLGAVAALGVLLGVVSLGWPRVRHEVVAGVVDWLFTRDPWMATIAECLSVFGRHRSVGQGLNLLWQTLGAIGVLVPVLGVLALLRVGRGDPETRAARVAPVAVVLLGLVVLGLTQVRLLRGLSGLLPAVAALGLAELGARIGSSRARGWGPGMVALGVALASLGLDPAVRVGFVTVREGLINGVLDAALHLRPRDPRDPGQGAGVLAPWDVSFEVLTLGRRPVVVSGFGPYLRRSLFDEAEAVWTRDEATLVDFLRRRDAGYLLVVSARVLSANATPTLPPTRRSADGRTVLNAALFRARPLAVLALGGSGNATTGVRHLEHLRPRFADQGRLESVSSPLPGVWVFERVQGAVLEGEAPDGTVVTADLGLLHNSGRRSWQGWTRATGGRWAMRVPLATAGVDDGVHTGDRYLLRAGPTLRGEAFVTERDVHTGRTIPVRLGP